MTRPLRVVIGMPWGEPLGGAERKLLTFLRHVDRQRIEPLVVFLARGTFESEIAALGFRSVTLPTGRLRRGGRLPSTVAALGRLFREEEADVVFGWGPKPQLYFPPAAALSRRSPAVAWMQTEAPRGAPVHRLAQLLPARMIVCSSDFVAGVQERQRPRRLVRVVYPGIDPLPEPSERDVLELRARLGVPAEAPVVGLVGRLAPVKGQDRLLRAFAALGADGADARLLFVGGDAHGLAPRFGASLRRLATDLGVADRVVFAGQAEDTTPYLGLIDVLVSAGVEEGFGIALLEGLAAGRAVVALDAGGPREIVEDGRSGVLVPAGDPQALTQAIASLLVDPARRAALGEAGRHRFAERFSAARMADELTSALEDVAAGR